MSEGYVGIAVWNSDNSNCTALKNKMDCMLLLFYVSYCFFPESLLKKRFYTLSCTLHT